MGWERRGLWGESRGGRNRRPDLARPPEQQQQGEKQSEMRKQRAGLLLWVLKMKQWNESLS